MTKIWDIRQSDIPQHRLLSESLGISSIIAQLLLNRGIQDINQAKTFLTGDIAELYDPFLMKGMLEAVERLKQAIRHKEKVFIHGDYDVDGVTAVALLVSTLRNFGIEAIYYIPDRLAEGYGLSSAGVKKAINKGADIVITVDCGISSYEEVEFLNAHNIDVIITDHHEIQEALPRAYSIINPLQRDCAYPDKNLSGVSLAFKLCEALSSEFNNRDVWKKLDLVSMGTISDVVPLLGENRILVKEGLNQLKNGSINKGLNALIEASGLKSKTVGSFEIGYILGPRINATGRIGSAETAVELLLTEDDTKAMKLAKTLNDANRERQRIESFTLKAAMEKIDADTEFRDRKVIVLDNEDWHAGVIGIVASRISDKFYRPTILISTKGGIGKGSGRSIERFHLFEALIECRDILKEYGGHKYACGFTIFEDNLDQFKETINKIADEALSHEDLIPRISVDMEISLSSLDYHIVEDISRLEPFGERNPEPLFCSRNLRLVRAPKIIKGDHIKLWVTDGNKNFEAIGFGLAKNYSISELFERYTEFDIAYTTSFNTWQGLNSIQLKIEDVRPSQMSSQLTRLKGA